MSLRIESVQFTVLKEDGYHRNKLFCLTNFTTGSSVHDPQCMDACFLLKLSGLLKSSLSLLFP